MQRSPDRIIDGRERKAGDRELGVALVLLTVALAGYEGWQNRLRVSFTPSFDKAQSIENFRNSALMVWRKGMGLNDDLIVDVDQLVPSR